MAWPLLLASEHVSAQGLPAWPSLAVPPNVSPDAAKDAAVIVGIDEYLFVPHVEGAAQNARDWFTFLVEGERLPVSRAHLLRNRDGSREQILSVVKQAAGEVEPGGRLWIVFIGHGAPAADGKEGVLVGIDAQQSASSLYARSVAQHELLDAIAGGAQAETLVVLDACFSGRTGSGEALAGGLQPLLPVAAIEPPKNVTVLSAGAHDQFAGPLPGTHRPAFSYLILGALRGWGDARGAGAVTAQDAIDYARLTLSVLPLGRTQTPELHGGGSTLVLSRGGAEKGPSIEQAVAGTELPVIDTSAPKAPIPTGPGSVRLRATCGNDPRAIGGQGGLKVVEVTDTQDVPLTPSSDPSPSLKYDDATHQRVLVDPDFVDFNLTAGAHRLRVSSTLCQADEERIVVLANKTVEFAPRLLPVILRVQFLKPDGVAPGDQIKLVAADGHPLCTELPCKIEVPNQSHYALTVSRAGGEKVQTELPESFEIEPGKGVEVSSQLYHHHPFVTWPLIVVGGLVTAISTTIFLTEGVSCDNGAQSVFSSCSNPSLSGVDAIELPLMAVGALTTALGVTMLTTDLFGSDQLDLHPQATTASAESSSPGAFTAFVTPTGVAGTF